MLERLKRERIRGLLMEGRRRSEIARELEVSPSTVTRYARLLGIPDAGSRASKTDWAAVQRFYDGGHTIDECKARFGFSYGAWDKAVTRGDLMTRSRRNGELSGRTRDQVEQLRAVGLSQTQIARELGLAKSTIAYHLRSLGVRADPRFARRHDWKQVQRAIDEEGLSMTQCLQRFGFFRDTWYRAVRRGDVVPRPAVLPLDELLVIGRPQTSRSHLKARLIKAGLKENRCERCGITEWMGQPLTMELHHVNGDGTDNRLENLQLLCGNCHAQTDNWGGRGVRREPVAVG
jgi:DNA-binding CsgD family transcriptional regulator